MSSFSREDRYIVVKRSDLAKVVSHYQVHRFMETLLRVGQQLPKRKFLVVEANWPEYEPVWRMIERRVTGLPNELDTAISQLAALREELARKDKAIEDMLESNGDMVQCLQSAEQSKHEPHCVLLDPEEVEAECTCTRNIEQRLADAERRNADLVELLQRAKPYIPWNRFGSAQYQWNLEVKDALTQPEEAKL